MDIFPVETILDAHGITSEQWIEIRGNQHFKNLLVDQLAVWNGALNTQERVKLKSAALIEEWLPELNALMHDRNQGLAAKVEAGKLAARLAELGLNKAGIGGEIGERFSVTINLGADAQLRFEHKVTPQVIDVTPNPPEE